MVVLVAEDVVTLASTARVVVFFEIGLGESRCTNPVEFGFAVLLEGFSHHFGGKPRLHVAQAFNGLIPITELGFVAIFQ